MGTAVRDYIKGKITALETALLYGIKMCPCWLTLALDQVNGIVTNRSREC